MTAALISGHSVHYGRVMPMEVKPIPTKTLRRLPIYLNYLKTFRQSDPVNISATAIAEAVGLGDVQVRKDLAMVCDGGRPKTGYVREHLIRDIASCLGYDNAGTAVIAGAGSLGRALLSYSGFGSYGLNIVAAFDTDVNIIGTEIHGKEVLSASKMTELCARMNIRIGIITVPAEQAQSVCDMLTAGGVSAVWNFAPVYLNANKEVLIKNENLAGSLALLSQHLKETWAAPPQR